MLIRDIMVVFTCDGKDGHCLCLDCFKEYSRLALTERRFIENAQSGYSIQCPSKFCYYYYYYCYYFLRAYKVIIKTTHYYYYYYYYVISPLQRLTLTQAASDRGSALACAEQHKNSAHFSDCQSIWVLFQPLAVESLRGWSSDASSAIRSIGRHLASRRGLDPREVSHYLFQRLSVSLWRSNAHMWLTRSPALPPLVDRLL